MKRHQLKNVNADEEQTVTYFEKSCNNENSVGRRSCFREGQTS